MHDGQGCCEPSGHRGEFPNQTKPQNEKVGLDRVKLLMEIIGRLEEDGRLAIESHHSVDAAVALLLDWDGIAENAQDVDVLVVEEGGEEGREIVVDDGGENEGELGVEFDVEECMQAADGEEEIEWRALDFMNLPGSLDRRPMFNSPYHYRLDWEVWIHTTASFEVSLSTPRHT